MTLTLTTGNLLTIAALTISIAALVITIGKGVMEVGAMRKTLIDVGKVIDRLCDDFKHLSEIKPVVDQHDKDISSLQAALRNGLAKETRENSKEIEVLKTVCRERHGHDVFTRHNPVLDTRHPNCDNPSGFGANVEG
jgi:hypothetical protein